MTQMRASEPNNEGRSGGSRRHESSLVPLAIAVVILSVALAWGLQKVGDGIASRGSDTVSVRGQAVRNVKADRAVWKMSVSQSAETAALAIGGLSAGVDVVLAYLEKNAVSSEDITLGGVSSFANKEFIDGNATGRILSYEANREVIIRMNDVDKIADLAANLGEVLARGVNIYTGGPEYYLDSLTALRPELLAEAMADAKVRATTLLGAVDAEVGDVRSVSSGPFQVTARDSTDVESGGYYDTASIEKTVIATVLVEFATS
ncbi:MAG: SIMPL domain-containing protein [Actinobacteria bacterium]|nr:SIMPL domain-containing protein [Actinomycetota bacterium]NBU07235.1 SIMPL domain-containing protein [Acidimicrobiia bacterium]NBX12779.1 SIMPL domain-containing protein [Acidimicrobiia bacterium]NDF69272.1 SIMPL domain-containing protein [Actinomycetota bacterium]